MHVQLHARSQKLHDTYKKYKYRHPTCTFTEFTNHKYKFNRMYKIVCSIHVPVHVCMISCTACYHTCSCMLCALTSLPSQPPRNVHPIVWFSTVDTPPLLVENFPFDKYELEPSPLTQYILAKRKPNICWQVTEQGGHATPCNTIGQQFHSALMKKA